MKEDKFEIKKIDKKMKQFVIIGLGRFGKSVATELANLGNEVLAIDTDAKCVNELENVVASSVVADATSNNVLYSLGAQNFDCAIICIGDDLQASILATLICKDLGIGYVVAKAQNEQHKKILERIGADMVIFPEVYVGKKVANILTHPGMNDIMKLDENYKIVEIASPDIWIDKTIGEINIRKKYKVTIIFIKRENNVIAPESDLELKQGDILVVSGHINKLEALSNLSSETIDAHQSIQNGLKVE